MLSIDTEKSPSDEELIRTSTNREGNEIIPVRKPLVESVQDGPTLLAELKDSVVFSIIGVE